jgi:hypothetical protein
MAHLARFWRICMTETAGLTLIPRPPARFLDSSY